jgi:hypothetical protein
MADDIKQANDELEQQAKDIAKNAQDVRKVQTSVNELSSTVGMCRLPQSLSRPLRRLIPRWASESTASACLWTA